MSKHRNRRRMTPAVWLTGGVTAVVLALAPTGVLGAFTASITNDTNTAATGALSMKETLLDDKGAATTTTCDSTTATCTTINKYGGTDKALVPGASHTTNIQIQNTGTVPATAFTLKPGTCTTTKLAGAGSGDLCGVLTVTVKQANAFAELGGATAVVNSVAANSTGFAGATIELDKPIAAGASKYLQITVTLPATADETVQGQQVSQPLTWTFTA